MTKEERSKDYARSRFQDSGEKHLLAHSESYLAGYTDCEREKDAVIGRLIESLNEMISDSQVMQPRYKSESDRIYAAERIHRAREALAAAGDKTK